jgi:hypothetical protein
MVDGSDGFAAGCAIAALAIAVAIKPAMHSQLRRGSVGNLAVYFRL